MTDLHLLEYHDAIKRGEIVAGVELIILLEKLVADLENPRYAYDTSEATRRMQFMENCVRLTKSPFYNKPMKLMLWQKAFLEVLYSFKMADTGEDRFKRILLLIARKNTKSETTSAIGLTELVLGEPGADIVCSSNDDNQASIVYDAIDTMRILIDPNQRDTWRNQRFIRNLVTNSKVYKLSDRTRNKEGRNIDVAIVDEVHEMQNNVIIKSIEQSQSLKSNPKLILITTEGFTNDGFLDNELIRARRILNGEDTGVAAERYLPWLYTQDSEAEVWQDESTWMKSNPSLGIVKRVDYLREQIDLARRSKVDRVFVLSKDFNFKMSNAEAWLMEEDYTYDAVYDLEDFRGSLALGAVDLAETTDLTCAKVLMMRPGDATKYVHTRYFIPESKLEKSGDTESGARYDDWARDEHITITPGNDVDLAIVADWFGSLVKEYGIRPYKIGYDVRFSKDFLRRAEDWGFDCELVIQNAQTLSNAAKLVEADLKDRSLNYNNNPVDRWCFGNASIKVDNYGQVLLVKIDNQRTRRIDGAVTTVILYEMFRRYRGEFLQNV